MEIKSVEDLCEQINVPINFLKYILYVKKNNYRLFTIPKKNGDLRLISTPNEELKYIQRQLLNYLEENYEFLDCQHGFIKGKSCVTNAKQHTGKRFILNMDIEDFFNNIHFGRVRGLFMNKPFNFSNEVATTIAKIVCYKKCLPQGAPTSPLISNMICYMMDKELNFIAKKNNCKYTRYADDITFSTDAESFPKKIAEIKDGKVYLSDRIIKNISGGCSNGFKLNDQKTKLYKRYVRQEVTGIVVNKKLNVQSQYIKKIRATLNNISKRGFIDTYKKTFNEEALNKKQANTRLFNYLAGKINYLKMVKGETDLLYLKYANIFNCVFNTETFDITDEIRMLKFAKKRCFVIESGGSTGTGFSISKNQIYTSTHVIVNDINTPMFIHDNKNNNYLKQFPLKDPAISYLLHPELKHKKYINGITITQDTYEKDIITLDIPINNKNSFKLAEREIKIGETVYMIGYPAFRDFENTSIHIQKTSVTGTNTYFGRKLINTNETPQHGMSGGPVLNTKGEVVGIVYAGFDSGSNENVGFISLI